jgi:anti-anti-sigma factor
MDRIEFMGSSGVAALVRLHTLARSLECRFVVVRPSRVVRRVLELVQLDTILMDGP